MLTPERFILPSQTDHTFALERCLSEMRVTGEPVAAYGDYTVQPGVLRWDGGADHGPGPSIETGPSTTLRSTGGRGPLLRLHNTTPMRFIERARIGGMLIVGHPQDEADADGDETLCGLSVSGVQLSEFGFMTGRNLGGPVIHVPRRLEIDPLWGDKFHVFGCVFKGAEGNRSRGPRSFTFLNESPNQTLSGCDLGVLRSTVSDCGAWKGAGGANVVRVLSLASPRGWGIDLLENGGATDRLMVLVAEIDAPEYGMRISGLSSSFFLQVRVNHRVVGEDANGDPVVWPKRSIALGGGSRPVNTGGNTIGVEFRPEPNVPGSGFRNLIDFQKDSGIFATTISASIRAGPAHYDIPTRELFANLSTHSYGMMLKRQGMIVHDTTQLPVNHVWRL